MRLTILNNLSLESKSLLLALLFHLCVAELFIFSLPVRKGALRPTFVFWGSFLDPITAEDNSRAGRHLAFTALSVDEKNSQNQFALSSEKPMGFPQTIAAEERSEFPKTTFLDDSGKKRFRHAAPDPVYDHTKIPLESLRLRITGP